MLYIVLSGLVLVVTIVISSPVPTSYDKPPTPTPCFDAACWRVPKLPPPPLLCDRPECQPTPTPEPPPPPPLLES